MPLKAHNLKNMIAETKQLLAFIKSRYPVGSLIHDTTRSQPYRVKKTSVFEAYDWDYSEEFMPKDNRDVYVDFLVRDRGKYAEPYFIQSLPKKWCIE
jgi:hypothetical protein